MKEERVALFEMLLELGDPNQIYNNYFFRFALLILIDEVFMLLYSKYRTIDW